MENVLSSPLSRSASSSLVFALPGILPEQTQLILDPRAHIVLFLCLCGEASIPSFRSFSLTPSATRVFLALLQAYPRYSSYEELFASLYPTSPEQGKQPPTGLMVRPIRRALVSLMPVLRLCGLQAVSLRGRGYVLASDAGTGTASSSLKEESEPRDA